MKKVILVLMTLVLGNSAMVMAQTDTSLTNPTNFQGWYGMVGKRITGTPDTNNLGIQFPANPHILVGNTLESHRYNATGTTICGSTSAFDNTKDRQYSIVTSVEAAEEFIHTDSLPRIPEGFTSAFRLGDVASTDSKDTNSAAAMFHNIFVDPATNGLVTIKFACVFRNPVYGSTENQLVTFRVVKATTAAGVNPGTTQANWAAKPARTRHDVPLNMTVYAPQYDNNGAQPLPDGWHVHVAQGVGCSYVYCDYQTVQFDLHEFAGQWVRLECYAADEARHQYGGYVFFAGTIGPATADSVVCLPGEANPTISVSEGFENYTWYRCGTNFTGDINTIKVADSAVTYTNSDYIRTTYAGSTNFLKFYKVAGPSFNNVYEVQPEDFVVREGADAGSSVSSQVFIARVTTSSGLDRNEFGRTKPNYMIVKMGNKKPNVIIDTTFFCDASVKLKNFSTLMSGAFDESLTKWEIFTNYTDGQPVGSPVSIRTGNEVTYQFPSSGRHAVRLSVSPSDTNCRSSKLFPINVVKSPSVSLRISPTPTPCPETTTTLSFTTPDSVASVEWKYMDGSSSNDYTATHVFTEAEDLLKLTVWNGQSIVDPNNAANRKHCTTTIDTVIRVFMTPNVTHTGDTVLCSGAQTDFNAMVEGDNGSGTFSYQWYKDKNCTQTACAAGPHLVARPTATADNPTVKYYLKVTTNQGCEAKYEFSFTVVTVGVTPQEQWICEGSTATMVAKGANSYTWTPQVVDTLLEGGGNTVEETVTVTPTSDISYQVTGTSVEGCTTSPVTVKIHLVEYPEQSVVYDPKFVDSENPTVTFNDQSSPLTSTEWVFENGYNMEGQQVTYTFQDLTSDSVAATMRSTNIVQGRKCTADTTILLSVDQFLVWVPNAFTPRLNGENSTFRIMTANQLEHFVIYIYSRSGQLVFTSTDQNFAWDGTYKDGVCPQGNYVYVMNYRRAYTDKVISRTGSVLLLW